MILRNKDNTVCLTDEGLGQIEPARMAKISPQMLHKLIRLLKMYEKYSNGKPALEFGSTTSGMMCLRCGERCLCIAEYVESDQEENELFELLARVIFKL